ncbi:MAG: 1-acyl-sn-glycerol-3-phosphate acyltransferase [Homoserinimonas sp.]|nr:1-acyl-sn-glycerol-3-phosphate acyltransferase [Homoserinimonas sp.]
MASGRPKPTRAERTFMFRFLASIVLPLMNLLGKYKVEGGEHLPGRGAVVVSPNHYSEIDPLVIGVAIWKLGRTPRYLAKASLFKVPILGWLLRRSDQIPVDRHAPRSGGDPLQAANQLVEKQLLVVVYPEGTLTRDPDLWPMRGKSGAVRLALEADVPLIPVAHWGTQQIMARYGKKISFFPRKKVSVLFGPPVDLSKYRGKELNAAALNKATDEVMEAIAKLLGELRGEEPPKKRWDPAKMGQSETGRFEERK